jgi:hypothetical protein
MFILKMHERIYWWLCLGLQLKEISNYVLLGQYINKLSECFWPLKIHDMKNFLEEEMFFVIQEKAWLHFHEN